MHLSCVLPCGATLAGSTGAPAKRSRAADTASQTTAASPAARDGKLYPLARSISSSRVSPQPTRLRTTAEIHGRAGGLGHLPRGSRMRHGVQRRPPESSQQYGGRASGDRKAPGEAGWGVRSISSRTPTAFLAGMGRRRTGSSTGARSEQANGNGRQLKRQRESEDWSAAGRLVGAALQTGTIFGAGRARTS